MTWTIEKLKEVEDRISIVVNEYGKPFLFKFCYPLSDTLGVIDRLGYSSSMKPSSVSKIYDHDMKLIEPPKEREFHIVTEYMNKNSLKTEFYNEGHGHKHLVKLPNGRKYKCYFDNGELEVME